MNHILYSFLWMAGAAALGIVLIVVAYTAITRMRRHLRLAEARIFLKHVGRSIWLVIAAFCIPLSLPFLRFPPAALSMIAQAAGMLFVASIGWLTVTILYAIREIILGRYDVAAKDNLLARRAHTQINILTHVAVAIVAVITVAFMLLTNAYVKQIGLSLLASAGVAGIIVGFAAQKLLGNILAGLQLALAQSVRIDDVVTVEGEFGRIEEITLTYVVVRLWDLRALVLPISYFVEKPFRNWTQTAANVLGTVVLYADFTVPVEEVRRELERILAQSAWWDRRAGALDVTGMTERGVELRALVSAHDSGALWSLRCEVREKLLGFLQQKHPASLPRVRLAPQT